MAAEREFRQSADRERDKAIAARREAEERMLEVLAAKDADAQKASQARLRPPYDPQATRRQRKTVPTTEPSAGGDKVQPRRRGRPAKSDQSEAEIVEWWKPGWRNR